MLNPPSATETKETGVWRASRLAPVVTNVKRNQTSKDSTCWPDAPTGTTTGTAGGGTALYNSGKSGG